MNKKETSEGLVFLFFVGFGMGDNLAGYGVGRSVGYNPRLNINNFQILILRCFLYSYLIRLLIQNYKSKFNKNGRVRPAHHDVVQNSIYRNNISVNRGYKFH